MSYLISVRLREARSVSGNTLTHEDKTGWLGYTEDGYWQIYTTKALAHRFDTVPEDVMEWSGFPWFCKIIPGSAEAHLHYTKLEKLKLAKRVIDAYCENEGYWPRSVDDIDYDMLMEGL